MNKSSRKWLIIGAIVLVLFFSVKGVYNGLVKKEQKVKSSWSQVENIYQSRFDKIPNLVNIVKGYTKHESETLIAVTEARAKVGGVMQMNSQDLSDPAKMAAFQNAQKSLGGALQRLMVVQERYPELKADNLFLNLQAEVAGVENRVAVERRRFNTAVEDYNVYIKTFPQVMMANMFGYREKAYFKADTGANKAPVIDMSN